MKKKIIFLFLLIILIIAIVSITKYRFKITASAPNPVWVKAAKVEESFLPLETTAIGTITARSIEVTSEVAGHVKEIIFRDGSFVKAGAALIQLDDTVYQSKFELAKAKLIYSELTFNRTRILNQRGIIAKQALEQTEADLKEKKADVKESEVMLDKMKLIAPFDGMVGQRKIHRGDYVTVGQSIVTLTDTKNLHVEYTVAEKYLPLIHLNQQIEIATSAYPNKKFTGKISYISPTINPANRAISLYAEITNDDNLLAPGMFVHVRHILSEQEHALLVPSRALIPILEGEQIYKITDGKAFAIAVSIGRRLGNKVQILEGLAPGDLIITDGQLKVKNGMPVKLAG